MAKKIKEVVAKIKLQIMAGQANPAPPVGPVLGQQGLNIAEFCKQFNDATKSKMGELVPVEITVYADRTYTFITKTAPASFLVKKMAKLKKGSGVPNRDKVGKLTKAQVAEIAEMKMPDLNCATPEAAFNIIAGTCRSLGVTIVD